MRQELWNLKGSRGKCAIKPRRFHAEISLFIGTALQVVLVVLGFGMLPGANAQQLGHWCGFFAKYKLMNAGVVGYASQKLSPDSGSINPLLKGYRDRGFGSGAEWKFTDAIHKLAFNVRYEWQTKRSYARKARC